MMYNIRAEANRSYFGIETDVHRTADGQYVIIRDEVTERLSREVLSEKRRNTAVLGEFG